MKPIYFPFTYISEPAAAALSACFKQTVVYQPSRYNIPAEMEKWAESGLIDIRIPVFGDEHKLEAILKDFRGWANLHRQGALDFLKAWSGKIPFFDETLVSQIRADISKRNGTDQAPKESDDIFSARLFLHIAQEFDLHNIGLNRDLRSFETMEQDLFKNLHGEDEVLHMHTVGKELFHADDPGLYLPVQRLKAWTKLMQQDREMSGVFITTSRFVFDELVDKLPGSELVIGLDSIPLHADRDETKWQDGFLESLNMLSNNAWPVSTDGMFAVPSPNRHDQYVSIKLYIAAGEIPYDVFTRCLAGNSLQAELQTGAARFKNTLIGIIES